MTRATGRYPLLVYLGAITLITLILTGGLLLPRRPAAGRMKVLVLLGILALAVHQSTGRDAGELAWRRC